MFNRIWTSLQCFVVFANQNLEGGKKHSENAKLCDTPSCRCREPSPWLHHIPLVLASSIGPHYSPTLFLCNCNQDTHLGKYPAWPAGFWSSEQLPTLEFALDSNTKNIFHISSSKFSLLNCVQFPPADLMHVRDVVLLDVQHLVVT